MNTKGVEDGTGCEHGTLTMKDGVMQCVFCQQPMRRTFNKEWVVQPAVPVEERTTALTLLQEAEANGAFNKRPLVIPTSLRLRIKAHLSAANPTPIPEERTAEMEPPAEVLHCDNGDYMVYIPCGIEIAHCRDEKIANWIRDKWNADHIEGKGK